MRHRTLSPSAIFIFDNLVLLLDGFLVWPQLPGRCCRLYGPNDLGNSDRALNFQTEDFNTGGQQLPIPNNVVSSVGLFDVFYTTSGNVDNTGERRESDFLILTWEPNGGAMTTTSLQLQFRAPINAFAADFSSISSALTISPIGVTNGAIDLQSVVGTGGFTGFIADSSFTAIDITSDDLEEFGIEDASFGNAVPEPSSLLFTLAVGLGVCVMKRSRTQDRRCVDARHIN